MRVRTGVVFLLATGNILGPALFAGTIPGGDPGKTIPAEAPRTWILEGQLERFREFSRAGAGEAYFNRIREGFDEVWMNWPFPEEPQTFGDPDPDKRTSDMVDLWRGMQDLTGKVSGVAEAATLLWQVTGEDGYLEKAKEFLLEATRWDPHGATGIDYNDEAHFRLFRKLPEVYDQIRDHLSPEEREQVLEHFRIRGNRNYASILEHGVAELRRNSVERRPASHSVRFMPMTGLAALALWDDLPEARDWWAFVYSWYRDVFTPWGGDDGGWAEGIAYWRGVYEHAIFQDALFAIGDPIAYQQPFWKNTGYFQVYFVQPYLATGFGDLSNAGQFYMEPGVKHFLEHLGKVTGNGAFLSWADLYSGVRPLPAELGIRDLHRLYPTAAEYWIREFIASRAPAPEPRPLSELPDSRYFADVGWVSMHSDLGDPEEDIMLSFKSSPYGSFSHSHGDQNSFILNAFGEQLAINAGYREYHRSQMHKYYTRQTESKNNILINRRGQAVQDKDATGKVVRFEKTDRTVWTTGDAAVAFNAGQPFRDTELVEQARRDIVFIDNRYFVVRDHVRADDPIRIDWLLHARQPITFHEADTSFVIEEDGTFLLGRLVAHDNRLQLSSSSRFPVKVDPKYADMAFVQSQSYLHEPAVDQGHFQANTFQDKEKQVIFAVMWPTRDGAEQADLKVTLIDRETLVVERPDGIIDRVTLNDQMLEVASGQP